MPIIKGNSYKRSIRLYDDAAGHTTASQTDDAVQSFNRRIFFNGSSLNALRIDYDRTNRPGYNFDGLDEINSSGVFKPKQTGIYSFNVRFQIYDYNSSGKIQGVTFALRDQSSSPVVGSTQGFQKLIHSFACPHTLNNSNLGFEQIIGHQTFLHRCVSQASYAVYACAYHSAGSTTGNIRNFSYNTGFPQNLIVVNWVSEA